MIHSMQKNDSPITVVVTRPVMQAKNLYEGLIKEGFSVLACPTLDISPIEPLNNLTGKNAFASIFTSVNAVYYAFTWLQEKQYRLATEHYLAIGPATKTALAENISNEIIVAEPNNSEGMLALALLQQVEGLKIFLFTGAGGRELLADSLRKRGAEVENIVVYRRETPVLNEGFSHFNHMLSDPLHGKIVVLITSVSSIIQLVQHTEETLYPLLFALPLIVASPRIASEAKALGFIKPAIVAQTASDEAMTSALKKNIHIL